MIIIGAGMSGLLCAALNPGSIVYEARPEKEQTHKAVFRCKSDSIGQILGIEFKKVFVYKSIWFDGKDVEPSPRMAHLYSQKVSGKILTRSILDITPCIRYIAPENFYNILESRCAVEYNKYIYRSDFIEKSFGECPVISTIPMPKMMDLLDMEARVFPSNPIYVNRIKIEKCDTYCTIYYPDPEINAYRASINGDILIIESTTPINRKDIYHICDSFGIPFTRQMLNYLLNHFQPLGKISAIRNSIREKIITDMTLKHNVYSLGRFATWRPKVMLDDVLKDISHIRKMIAGGDYAVLKKRQNERN